MPRQELQPGVCVGLVLEVVLRLQQVQAPTGFGEQSMEDMMCAQCDEHDRVLHAADHVSNGCLPMRCQHPCHSLFHPNCPETQVGTQHWQSLTWEDSPKQESFPPKSSNDCAAQSESLSLVWQKDVPK